MAAETRSRAAAPLRGLRRRAEEPRASRDGGGTISARKGEGLRIAPVASHQIEIGGVRDCGILHAVVQLVNRIGGLGKNLGGLELSEDSRPARVLEPERQDVHGVRSREVGCSAGELATGQKGLDGLEGLELHPSLSARTGRRRLPVKAWG